MSKQHNEDKKSQNSGTFRALASFSQIGVTIAASVLVGVLLGQFLDGKFGTEPWLLIVFSILGMGAGIKSLFNIAKDKNDKS